MTLAFPAAASAHVAKATISCTGVNFTWFGFAAGQSTVHYTVTVDDNIVADLTTSFDTRGQASVPLTLTGTHVVKAFSFWFRSDTAGGFGRPANSPPVATLQVTCGSPPTPPTPPTTTTTTTTTPTTPAASSAPITATATPNTGVLGTQARSATARVSAQRRCATRTARITVSGRLIRRVTFFVNGRRVRTVTVRAGQTRVSVSVPVRRSGASRQTVTARVTFRNGAASRTLTAHATRCAAAAARPNFTG